MIWAKERRLWKIVGIKSADGPDPGVVTLERRPAPQAERPGEDASPDPAIVSATSDFLESWFVRRDYRKAMSYISPRAKACVESAAQDRGEAGFAGVAKRLPKVKELSLAIRPVTPWNSETKIVRHGKEDAFTLMSIPDGMALAMQCDPAEPAGIAPPAASATARFYQTAFQLRLRNGESGALLSLWEKEDGKWRLVAWEVQAP